MPNVAIATLVGAVALLSLHTLTVLRRPPDPIAKKFAAAERTIVYKVGHERGPRFRLGRSGAAIKVVTCAVVPGGYDPARRVGFGFRVTIEQDGRTLWTDDVHIESRQSKGRRIRGGVWLDEGAFTADPVQLADERILIIEPPVAPAGAILTLTLLGEPDEALVRLFRESDRDPAQRDAVVEFLDEAERWELVRSSTYVPWELLPDDEKDRRLKRRWTRMSALGERGSDYDTRTIFVTDYRAPIAAVIDAEGIEVSRHRWAAINVTGPTTVTLAVDQARAHAVLDVHAVGIAAGPWRLALDEPGELAIDVPEGPATLVVATEEAAPLRFTMSGPPDALLAPLELRAATRPGILVPDRVRIELAVAGPDAVVTAPARDVPGAPLLGRVLRLDARVIDAPIGSLDTVEPALATLAFRFVAGDGKVIGEDQLVIGGPASRFERVQFAGGEHSVGEPSAVRTIAPEKTARIEITADRPVALRLYRWGGGATTIEEPYLAATVPDHRWRYVELVDRTWYPLLPSNHDALATEGRLAQLDAQARLEPGGPLGDIDGHVGSSATSAGTASGTLVTVDPVGHPEQQRAREPVPDDQIVHVLTHWPVGSVATLAPGVARAIDFPAKRVERARISWEVDASAVGGELVVAIGTLPAVTAPITATRGSITLPRVPPGVHGVRATAPAGAALWIDRPPSGPGAWRGLYRERRLFSLAQPLRVHLVKRAGERIRLHAIVYAAGDAASADPALRITVGGGRPMRRSGVVIDKLTDADRSAVLPAARRAAPARLIDRGGESAGLPRTISLTLLEDLVPGTHEIAIYNLGGKPMWVRFVATGRPAASPSDPRQWQLAPVAGWEDDDAP